MKVEIFTLCDAATVDAVGKLNILGSFDRLNATAAPVVHPQCSLAIKLRFQRIEEGKKQLRVTFIDQDGIPWHNNTAERAIRHISKQRAISTNFHASVMNDYLILLGIRQACRFQGKSFLKFLFSGETDLDRFEARKRKR